MNTKFYNPTDETQISIARTILAGEGIIGVCGNGGSAGQAHHLVGELVPYGVPCLAFNDISALTAIANDDDWLRVYSQQIYAFRDFLKRVILLTTSGNSKNIQVALEVAQEFSIPITLIMGDYNKSKIRLTAEHMGIKWEDPDQLIMFPGDTPAVQEKTLHLIHHIYKLNKNDK